MSLLPALAAVLLIPSAAPPGSHPAPSYAKDIRPVLQARCVVCHNQQTIGDVGVSGRLALDTYAAVRHGVKKANGFQAIFTAGQGAASDLVQRLQATSPTKMMPKGGPPLLPAQIALIQRWIDAGAPAGNAGAEQPAVRTDPAHAPMPAPAGRLAICVSTVLASPGPAPAKSAPVSHLTFDAKIGPLAPVTAIAFSPDGSRLAVGGYRSVVIWDTDKGQPVGAITGLAGAVEGVVFRPGGKQIAVCSGQPAVSGEVKIYDAATLALAGELKGHTDLISAIAWSADGAHLATASQDKTARVWDWPSGKAGAVLRDHSDAVTAVAFSPDGKSVYTASLDHNVRRFESDSGKLVRTFTGHNDAVLALTITADGKGLISSGQEPPLRWWNPDTGDTTSIQYGPNGPVNGLSLSPDGKYLVSAGSDGSVRLWETGSRNDVHTFTAGETWQFAAACAPGGKLAAGAGADGVIRLWDVAGQKLRIAIAAWPPVKSGGACEWIALTPEGYFDGSQGWVSALRIRPDNRAIALPLAVIQPLHRPSEVLKAWHDADLQAASLALSPANVSQKAETAPKFPKPSTARGR